MKSYSKPTRKILNILCVLTVFIVLFAGYMDYTEHPASENIITASQIVLVGFVGFALVRAWKERPNKQTK